MYLKRRTKSNNDQRFTKSTKPKVLTVKFVIRDIVLCTVSHAEHVLKVVLPFEYV